jgi:hypothetical protein
MLDLVALLSRQLGFASSQQVHVSHLLARLLEASSCGSGLVKNHVGWACMDGALSLKPPPYREKREDGFIPTRFAISSIVFSGF